MLNLIKNRIAPIIEQQLRDSQYGFRTGRGTRNAICQLRIMMERCQEMQKKHCFNYYTKSFDRVKHHMLFEILAKAGVPDTEINIIKSLYLQQKATCYMKMNVLNQLQYSEAFDKDVHIGTVYVQHIYGILDKRSTGGWRGNKQQWTKYHKLQICRLHNHTGRK